DWKDVRMALVSGRPISFQMDLYQPLYVPRPTVEPELFASLRPQTYSGGLRESEALSDLKPDAKPQTARFKESKDRAAAGLLAEAAPDGRSGASKGGEARKANGLSDERLNLGQGGVGSAATASKLGDFFQYTIDRPVSLPRQKSALLPIVG